MPPANPPLKNDGPACRVCGCTENNACLEQALPLPGKGREERWAPRVFGCSWVETSGNDVPRWLCSACSGTVADMAETIDRGMNILLKSSGARAATGVVAMARAAKVRYEARHKAENRG